VIVLALFNILGAELAAKAEMVFIGFELMGLVGLMIVGTNTLRQAQPGVTVHLTIAGSMGCLDLPRLCSTRHGRAGNDWRQQHAKEGVPY